MWERLAVKLVKSHSIRSKTKPAFSEMATQTGKSEKVALGNTVSTVTSNFESEIALRDSV